MKKIIIALLTVVMIVCCFTLVACNDKADQETLQNYIFELNNTVVTEDFTLPSKIGGKDVEWKSDKSEVTLEKRAEDYLAKVTLPESGEVDVKLTVSLGKQSRDFTVIVEALDVIDFVDNYSFLKDKATVVADFDLDKTVEYMGKTATITWSVDEKYELLIEVNEAGDKCIVYQASKPTAVKIKATFDYNGEKATATYSMNVYREITGMELVDYWYTNTGVSIDMSGYVVLIGTEYSEKYKNVTLYMVNDDFTAGYYLYRVKTDDENAALLKPGVHVTVTGTTNTNYNGLIETNGDGNLVVDTDVPEINVNEKVFAIDELVIGNLPATVYHESRLVSLTNWKVKTVEKQDEIKAGENFTILTLTKSGVDVNVRISKYLEGAYKANADDPTWKALTGIREAYPAGSTINVTGIFTRYGNNWQIMPLDLSNISDGATPDADDKRDYVGNKVAVAVATVNEAIEKGGLNARITTEKVVNLPTTKDEVAISYAICGTSKAVKLEGGEFTITPGNPESTHILVTYKVGNFETIQYFYIESLVPTAATMVEDLAFENRINEVTELPTIEGATIVWTVISGNDNLKIENNQLIPTLEEEDVLTVINAKLTYNGETREKEFNVIVKAGKGAVASPAPFEADKEYVLAVKQGNLDKTLYGLGEMDGHYMKATDNTDEAKAFKVEVVDGKYKIYIENKDAKKYIGYEVADNGKGKMQAYLAMVATDAPAWEWDAEANCFKTEITVDEQKEYYYFGTYNKFETFSLSKFSYVSTSFPAFLGTIQFVPLTANEIKVDEASSENADVTLNATSGLNGQKFTFSVAAKAGFEIVSVKVNGAVVEGVDGVYTGVVKGATTVKVETKVEGAEDPNKTDHAGTAEDPYTVEDVYKIFNTMQKGDTLKDDQGNDAVVYVTGIVIETGTWSDQYGNFTGMYIASTKDAAKENQFYVYRVKPIKDDTCAVGDTLVISGNLTWYASKDLKQLANGQVISRVVADKTDAEKVAEVLDALTISQTKVTEDGEITLPTSNNADVTLAWVSNHAQAVVAADNSKVTLTVNETEVVVTLTVTATCNGASDTKTFDITLVKAAPVVTDHAGTEADPFSVADVLKILDTLEKGTTYSKDGNDTFYIKGYVITGEYNTQYKNFDNFTIGDTADATTTVVCFRPKMAEGVETAKVGDLVVLKGKLQWYQSSSSDNNSKQVAQGASIVSVNAGETPAPKTDAEKVADVLAALTVVQTKFTANGEMVLPVSNNAEVTLAWASNNEQAVVAEDFSKVTLTVTDTTVVATLTVTATCNEASDTKTFDITLGEVPPQVVTVAQALALPDGTGVIVTGVVTEVNEKWSEKYSNITVTITDAEGGELYIYRLATLVGIGDTITVTGKMGTYKDRQIAAGATATIDAPHVCTEWTEADCVNAPKCTLCAKDKEGATALGHVDENADNLCDRCNTDLSVSYTEEAMDIFANTGVQTEDLLSITWTSTNFTVTGNKNTSKTAIRITDTDHFRVYQGSSLEIAATNDKKIAKVVITCVSADYATKLQASLTTTGVTASVTDAVVTITVDSGTVESISFVATAQTRITNVAIFYVA